MCRWFLRPTLFLCASVAHTLAVRSKLPATPRKRMSPAKVATTLAVTATGAVFVNYKMAHAAAAAPKDALMAQGLFYSFLALCGNTAAALLRKQVSRGSAVRPAEQVGLATAIQGVAAVVYCYSQGLLGTAVAGTFLLPAVGSSVLNALTKTLETKAYAITDVSLCAPFLAFDPVMQFLLPALLAPAACALGFGVACSEARSDFPPNHPLAVACVATGAYLLSKVAAERAAAGAAKKVDDENAKDGGGLVAGLPVGAWFILFNCCVYAAPARAPRGSRFANPLQREWSRSDAREWMMNTPGTLRGRPERGSLVQT